MANSAPLLVAQIGAGAVDQEGAQRAIPLFEMSPGTMLAAGAVVFAGEPDPSRRIAATAERLGVGAFAKTVAGDDRSDARHLHQPAGVAIGTGGLGDLFLERALVGIKGLPVPGPAITAHRA